jgi:hypothetical protein
VALNTTIAGLVVAVITVILHSFFTRRLERVAARFEVIAGQLLTEFYKHGGPAIYEVESAHARDAMRSPDKSLVEAIEQSGREAGEGDSLS